MNLKRFLSPFRVFNLQRQLEESQKVAGLLRQNVEQQAERQHALLEIMQMDVSDLTKTLNAITKTSAETLNVERVSVWFFSKDRSNIVCENLFLKSNGSYQKGAMLLAKDFPHYFKCLERQLSIVANSALRDPQVSEFAQPYLIPLGIRSMMDIPIWLEGKVIGILCHEHVGPERRWTREEEEFGTSMAYVVSIALSVSERIRAEKELVRINEELRSTNESRLAFTSMVSHEVRTPLCSIKAALDLVLQEVDGPLNVDQRETLLISKDNVDRLNRLINDILDFTRLEVGRMDMSFQDTSLNQLLQEVCTFMKMEAEKKKISLEIYLPTETVLAHCDPDKIKMVVINLIHNAVKFTPSGGAIYVTLRTEDNQIFVSIRDTGLGIPLEAHSQIFQMFRQGPASSTWKAGGSGVGLAVCKFIMEKHQGSVAVESSLGKGSTFTMILPFPPISYARSNKKNSEISEAVMAT